MREMSGDFGKSGVKYILEQAKNFNREIGSYQVHAVDPENFNYVIKLSNGRISITWEELQERYYLTEEGMRSIAGRFVKLQPGC